MAQPDEQIGSISPVSNFKMGTAEEDFPLQTSAPPQALEPSPTLAFESEIQALIVHFHNLQSGSAKENQQYRIVHHRPSVKFLLEAGPKLCMKYLSTSKGKVVKSEDPDLRWIHVPANNESWIEVCRSYILRGLARWMLTDYRS